MARLLSKSCFLALVVIFLFVTFAAFFDSLPHNPYHGNTAVNPDNTSKDDSLKGAVGQVPAQTQASDNTGHDTTAITSAPSPNTPESSHADQEKNHISEAEKKAEEEKVRAEKFKKNEEEQKKLFEATKVSTKVSFSVPANIKYDPEGPRPDQIILLCASDGKGHNGGIQNLIEITKKNRQDYADLHGYKYHFLNISKYDISPAHPVWAKLPAIAETFETYPEAQWVWWLDLDAIVMTPTVDLNKLLLSHKALNEQVHKGEELNKSGGGKSGILTLKEQDVKNIDLIFSQDQNGINAGSFFIRRSEWSRMFLDMWADPLFVIRDWTGQEQDAVMHLVTKHHTVMEHFGLVGQRVLNSYPIGVPHMGWAKGDLVVHLAGCWVENQCSQRWDQYMALKENIPEKKYENEDEKKHENEETDESTPP